MGRPKKETGSRVHDQFHVGVRFEPDIRDLLLAKVEEANALLRSIGAPETVTPSSLVKHQIRAWLQPSTTVGIIPRESAGPLPTWAGGTGAEARKQVSRATEDAERKPKGKRGKR